MLLAWRALKGFQAAYFWGESCLQAVVTPRHPYVPFHKVGMLALLPLSFVSGLHVISRKKGWEKERKCCHLHGTPGCVRNRQISALVTIQQVRGRDLRETKWGRRGWLSGCLPWTCRSPPPPPALCLSLFQVCQQTPACRHIQVKGLV